MNRVLVHEQSTLVTISAEKIYLLLFDITYLRQPSKTVYFQFSNLFYLNETKEKVEFLLQIIEMGYD